MKRSRNARYAAAALALGLALGARPALGQDQAAAPPPGVLPTCMNFSVSRDIGALRQRIRAARQAKRAPREAGLYESIVRHAQCSAFVQGDNGPCLDLAALGSNYAQYQAQCASLLARVSFWRDISAGTIGPRDIEQCGAVAATGVDANALCRRMVALWARRSGDVCQ
ncbi:MAG: hypothetical protein KGK30_08790, partial [Elusimicrobia bacterium]|nr:hypothetical protein [Elusimicrobiota bacterium]